MAVKVGNQIPLVVQISDEDTGVFPRAIVRDAAGVPIAGSPVALSHVALGLYKNTSLVMPATDRVFAQYQIFQDAGFTIRHPIHADTLLDVFERDTISEALDALNKANGLKGDITGFVDDIVSGLSGVVLDDDVLLGVSIDDDALVGSVQDAEELTGYLFTDEIITGTVVDC